MKTYKNLWESFISIENFQLAAAKAVQSKRNKRSAKYFLSHQQELLEKLRQDIIHNRFKTSEYKTFYVFEPKKRIIYELPLYPDHILHHAIINIMGDLWQKSFIQDSYACIPGRGLHGASKRVMQFVKRNKYVLQCDIKKFYPSIRHDIVMDILIRKIKDKRILRLLRTIVYSIPGGKNLPIGNLTSQWLGNVYLNQMDMFIKHILKCRDYVRYSDDFCLFSNDKSTLNHWKTEIQEFIEKKLSLSFSKCILRRTCDGVNFVGYRHFPKFILLRKRSLHKIRKRITTMAQEKDTSKTSESKLAAAKGWLRFANTYNYKKDLLKRILAVTNKKTHKFIKQRI